jgi:hypothetical protein
VELVQNQSYVYCTSRICDNNNLGHTTQFPCHHEVILVEKFVNHSPFWSHIKYEGEPVNRSQREVKTAPTDAIGFLCVSLHSSMVHLHDILGSRCTCTCSEAGFSSQNGDCAWGV